MDSNEELVGWIRNPSKSAVQDPVGRLYDDRMRQTHKIERLNISEFGIPLFGCNSGGLIW